MTTYVYVWPLKSGDLYTVGFYNPDGDFMPESDHSSADDAAWRVHFLNGGSAVRDVGAEADPTYLIWSNEHRAWWGPEERGYVQKVAEAGRYSRDRAFAIVAKAQYGRGHMANGEPPEIAVLEADALATLKW